MGTARSGAARISAAAHGVAARGTATARARDAAARPGERPARIGNFAMQQAADAARAGEVAAGSLLPLLKLDGPIGRRGDIFERHADASAARLNAPPARAPAAVPRAGAARQLGPTIGGGQPLEPALRERLELSLGGGLGDVRVHDSPRSRHTAAVLGARAFTSGRDVHLGQGQSASDLRLMAHEASHVMQQRHDTDAPRLQLDATNQTLTAGYAAALNDGDLMYELQAAEALTQQTKADDPTRTALTENIGVLRREYFSRHPGAGAETGETAAPPAATPSVGAIPAGGTSVGRVGIVAWDGETPLRLRSTPDTVSVNLIAQLPFGMRLQVVKSFPGDWYFVSTANGLLGYVASTYVRTDLPEPNARLHRVQPGLPGTAIAIAERYYGEYANDWGQDLRFYVNVLAWANGINVPDKTSGWRQVHFNAGQLIWVPSQRFAYGLKGAVNSGSLSWNIADAIGIAGFLDRLGQLWDDFSRALDYADEFRAEALARRIEESAKGMVEGLVQMIKLAIAILAITTAVGALLGGILGVGAGAAPGAAAGFEVGMVIIEWLGLGMLVVWIGKSLIELGAAFGSFLGTVWNARGDRDILRRAGAQWADAIALMIAKILEALLMLVMARGLPKGVEALRGTRLGAALGESRAGAWLAERSANVQSGKSPIKGPGAMLDQALGRGRPGAEAATVTQRGNAVAFHDLPPGRLPANLPAGHFWMRSADGTLWVLMRETGAAPVPFDLVVAADAAGNTNYVLSSNGRQIVADTITNPAASYSGPRLPQSLKPSGADSPFRDPVTGGAWDKGHGSDYADTREGPGVHNLSTDPANFTPQASWWNQGPRNSLVGRIRNGHPPSGRPGGGGYREMAMYADNAPVTANGTPIPRDFIFVETNPAGVAVRAWRIPNIQGAAGRGIVAIDPMAIPLADVPPIMLRAAPPLTGPGGGATVYGPGMIFGMPGDRETTGGSTLVCKDDKASSSVDTPVCQ